MTQTFAVNQYNDIYIGEDGNLAIVYDLTATTQACQQAAKTILGEMIYAADQGLPYFEAVWIGVPQIAQYEAALRSAFLGVPGVLQVISLVLTQTENNLNYTATIMTTYGQGVISG